VPSYVLTYRPGPVPPEAEVEALRQHEGVRILDRAGRSFYVECSETTAKGLASALPDWTVAPEEFVPLPDPRPRTGGKAAG
jgi:hypothetical protein